MGGEEWRSRRDGGKKEKGAGSGMSAGREAWRRGKGMRDEREQGADGWLEGWAERVVGVLVSLLAQHFPAHTTSTQLHTDPGGALSRAHAHLETLTHKPTPKHTLLQYC